MRFAIAAACACWWWTWRLSASCETGDAARLVGVRLSLAAPGPAPEALIARMREIFAEGTVRLGDQASLERMLCNCFGVPESEVDAFLAVSPSLESLQATLKRGTRCGSCLPELQRKLAA